MTSNVFNKFDNRAERANISRNTKRALSWFRNVILKDRTNFDKVGESLETVSRPKPGEMITFQYDPKHKKTLPFYDMYPLIIFLEPAEGGFYGANLHYLPPVSRQKLFEELNHNRVSMAAVKAKLENNPMTKYCLKRYLSAHLRSKMRSVPKKDWEIAIFLPFEKFVGESKKKVWRRSK